MKLIINSQYSDQDCVFNISPNIMVVVSDVLEDIEVKNKLNYDLGFTISSKKKVAKVFLQGPLIDKSNKAIYHTLWMPFNFVYNSSNYLETYLNCLEEGLIMGLEKYNIDPVILIKKFIDIKKEILSKPNIYTYSKEAFSVDFLLNNLDQYDFE